jgi:anti-anti-sigma factor
MLRIDVEERGDAVIVMLDGELSFTFIEKFEAIFKKYHNSGFRILALDLNKVPYLDSFGMSRIIKTSRSLSAAGTGFVLINISESVMQVLRIATFDRLFNIMTRDQFFLSYIPDNRPVDLAYSEIIEEGRGKAIRKKELKVKQMEFVDENGATVVILDEE